MKSHFMFGNLNEKEIDDLLGSEIIGRIGCHAENTTYIIPISYAYEKGVIYCHKYEGMMMRLLRKNPDVCFQVDNTRDLGNWQSVICWGKFEEISDPQEITKTLQILNTRPFPKIVSETMRLSSSWPFAENVDAPFTGILIRINLTLKTGRYEKSNQENFFVT